MVHDEPQRDDPYQVLGVRSGASMQDIVRAYRRAALAAHPDAQPADPGAAGRFRTLSEAYALLSDPGRRAAYDRGRARRNDPSPEAPSPRSAPWPAPQPAPRPAWPGSQPALWAGPVHIEPSPGRADVRQRPQPGDLAGRGDVLRWYLHQIWGWPS